jgi:hypothetical protein
MLLPVARTLCERNGHRWPDGTVVGDLDFWHRRKTFMHEAEVVLDAVLAELRRLQPIVLNEGVVVHQLRGSPEDLWRLLLSGIAGD